MIRLALRTLLQKPAAIAMVFVCLASFSFLISIALLLETRLEQAVRFAAEHGPSLTIEKKNPNAGPFSKSDLTAVQNVTGVLKAAPSASPSMQQPPASRMDIFVFSDNEINAVVPDIRSAVPWPATLISKTAYTSASLREIASRGTLLWWVLLPAGLALMYVFLGQVRHPLHSRKEAALLKALGWTSSDIFRFFSTSAALLGAPPTLLGAAFGWIWVRFGNTAVAESVLFGYQNGPAAAPIGIPGALFCIFVTVSLIFILWIPAVLAPSVRAALSDPEDLLQEDEC